MSASPSLDAPWSLAGKTALVTGCSRGIVASTAMHLTRKGLTKLAITYATDAEAAGATLKPMPCPGRKAGDDASECVCTDYPDNFSSASPAYGGRVINISSTLAKQGNSDPVMTYGASKAALQSYTRSLADTFSKSTGATFNSIIVGLIATEAIKKVEQYMPPGFMAERIQETSAADRIGVPDDIAYIIGFLCSEEGRWVNGAAVSANGGNRFVMAALG